jgi:L-alanine-DL-glutamate epimerase-like enolase superfamily enzyme
MLETSWNQPPPYSAVIPLLPPDSLEPFVSLLRKNQMRHIKIKVGARLDLTVFELIRSLLGTDVDLRVDANGAWTEKEALKNIELMGPYNIRAVEQPVAKENIRGLREVTVHSRALIIADESVCSLEDARRLLDTGACHAFNVRLSKCGGFFSSLAILGMARRSGLSYQIGCQVGETGILSAAGRHLAGWFSDILYLEGSFGNWVLQEDIVQEDVRFGMAGQAQRLMGKGLGVQVSIEALERYSVKSQKITF